MPIHNHANHCYVALGSDSCHDARLQVWLLIDFSLGRHRVAHAWAEPISQQYTAHAELTMKDDDVHTRRLSTTTALSQNGYGRHIYIYIETYSI